MDSKQNDEALKKNRSSHLSGNFSMNNQPDNLSMLSSKALDYSIKQLVHPAFMGSMHFNKERMNNNMQSVENLMSGELELKINKSLKSTLFNPITKVLILVTILFNIFWLLFFYVL